MPINVPPLDDRNYADILQDALARIPVHNKEWTNFNDTDPGVTLIQLFAFMTESILYRANQIPERNRLKFLQLLGIPLVPAAAAQGFITITNDRGPLNTQTLATNLDVRAGQVRFRTTQGLDVLPITAQMFYKRPIENTEEQENLYRQLYADLLGEEQEPAFYETASMVQPFPDGSLPTLDLAETIDGCLWIALLARPEEDLDVTRAQLMGKTLTLGIMPRLDEAGVSVAAGQSQRAEAPNPLRWEIVDAADTVANYRPLASRSAGSVLAAPGLVELDLPGTVAQLTSWNFAALEPGLEGTGDYPPSLIDTDVGERLITWIRLRLDRTTAATGIVSGTDNATNSLTARLSWIGINATQVQQRVQVAGELMGTGTGEPDQVFRFANVPVIPESVVLTVDNEPWQQIDDLLTADPEVPIGDPRLPVYRAEAPAAVASPRTQVFTLDPESGIVTFGDGAHGARPRGRIVVSYAFGGGLQGNVGIGAINRSPQLPAGYTVANPLRTWGGDNAQDTSGAEKGISRYVQHRDRLVAVQDFEDITRQTPGIDLGRVAVLPLYVPTSDTGGTIPGAVTVMVIPASTSNNNPLPDQFFLEAVCNHLQPRRLVTTELHVYGPQYVDVWISVGIELLGGYGAGPVREAVKQELYRFLSPLYGGQQNGDQQGTGWPLNVSVLQAELEAVVARVDGVRLVNDPLRLGTATTDDVTTIELTGLMLPRLVGVSVVSGAAIALDQLRNAPSVATAQSTPIPVLPERC
ncbi:MAG: baseplate J/gp47 family protein [Cyanobacteria bacterium P01_D01_bin.156]